MNGNWCKVVYGLTLGLMALALLSCGKKDGNGTPARPPARPTAEHGHGEDEAHRAYTVADLHAATTESVRIVRAEAERGTQVTLHTAKAGENVSVSVEWKPAAAPTTTVKKQFLCHFHGQRMACHVTE